MFVFACSFVRLFVRVCLYVNCNVQNIRKDDASAELHLSKFAVPIINTLQGDNRLAMNAASLSYLAIKTIVGEDGLDKVFTSEQQQIANDNKFVVRNSR